MSIKKLVSGLIGVYIVLTPCLALGHHTSNEAHSHHVEHTSDHSEHHSGNTHNEKPSGCNNDCCCDELIAVTNTSYEITQAAIIPFSRNLAYQKTSFIDQNTRTALARDGPIFEQAKIYSSTIAMRT